MPIYKGMNLILPEGEREIRPYFEAARQGRLVVKRCGDCGLLRYPPGAACPWCSSLKADWTEVTGRGTVYSYEVVTQAIQPGFAEWLPYAVVLVELDEQRGVPTGDEALRIIANLVTPDFLPEAEDRVAIGRRVRAVFQPLDDDLALPQFTLTDEPAQGRVWQLG
ncbi:MAG: OB-fold domain-containing protein [Chloroflexi bacterium]|nr:OB-fold domain-containing protein [Chloroflexota bacterium]